MVHEIVLQRSVSSYGNMQACTVQCYVGNKAFRALADTGAQINLINVKLLNEIDNKDKRNETHNRSTFMTANGQHVEDLGTIELAIHNGYRYEWVTFSKWTKTSYPMILGINYLKKGGAVTIDFEK